MTGAPCEYCSSFCNLTGDGSTEMTISSCSESTMVPVRVKGRDFFVSNPVRSDM